LITRDDFSKICENLHDSYRTLIDEVFEDFPRSRLHEAVLIGGTSRIPAVKEVIRQFCGGGQPLLTSLNPKLAVIYGACYKARYLTLQEQSRVNNIDHSNEIFSSKLEFFIIDYA
jgi:heat shock protein 1/8